jgi:hypothetical protein
MGSRPTKEFGNERAHRIVIPHFALRMGAYSQGAARGLGSPKRALVAFAK